MTNAQHRSDAYTCATAKIVADLEQGTGTWQQPWNADNPDSYIIRLVRATSQPCPVEASMPCGCGAPPSTRVTPRSCGWPTSRLKLRAPRCARAIYRVGSYRPEPAPAPPPDLSSTPMKHASPETLHHLAPLLARLRALPGLVERRPGCFYRRGQAFLHFHDDPAGLFADVRLHGVDFSRHRISTAAEQAGLLAGLLDGRRAALNPPPASADQTPAPAPDAPAPARTAPTAPDATPPSGRGRLTSG